jgi:hypothetical protein
MCLAIALAALLIAAAPGNVVSPGGGELSPPADQTAGYLVTIHYPSSDAAQGTVSATIRGRAPTRAESPLTPNGDAYFYFTITLSGTQPVRFPQGATVEVVFPESLDPSLVYSLTLGFADTPIGPITGALRKNTLRFVLPPFIAKPGVELMGEIDGDPPSR